jgi:hypothetical protein
MSGFHFGGRGFPFGNMGGDYDDTSNFLIPR